MTRSHLLDLARYLEACVFGCTARHGLDRPTRLAALRHALACLDASQGDRLGEGDAEIIRKIRARAEVVVRQAD